MSICLLTLTGFVCSNELNLFVVYDRDNLASVRAIVYGFVKVVFCFLFLTRGYIVYLHLVHLLILAFICFLVAGPFSEYLAMQNVS